MPLRVVHLEDDPRDRELVEYTLRGDDDDYAFVQVTSRETFERALEQRPDVILADYALPGFDGDQAQAIARRRWPDVPFVFVSGSIGEEKAVERLKSGATDYVFKHHLDKLPTAVRRALREAEERRRRAAAEEELRRLNTELEARVEARTRELREANEALERARSDAERANAAKSEFLSRMSHDLRTPLNAILGFAQLLLLDPLGDVQADNVRQILGAGEHLLELINEILDLARIEAGRLSLSPEPVLAAHVIQRATEMIAPLAAPRHLTVDVDAPPGLGVIADRQRLHEVLLNLLSNAVKYNREQGRIFVSAAALGTNRVRIDVRDTGAGIPPEKLRLLFTPFERLGAEQSRIPGTGLGLALAKALTEAMGGTLTVTSDVDRGTTFHVDLRRAEAIVEAPPAGAPEVPTPIGVRGTILYVEDNLQNVQLIERVLTRRPGVELLHAIDGAAGLELVRTHRPDLVLLDLHLSDMHGEEVLRRLWEAPATRSLPVVVLTADATPRQHKRLLGAGAVAYLTKPFRVAEMLAIIDRFLGEPQ
jgi:signal transduction histidine kinase